MKSAVHREVVSVRNLSKRYEIYERPVDRLKQFTLAGLHSALSKDKGHSYGLRGTREAIARKI
jgi:hypothetical protein